jgi:hypothetical protein
MYAKNVDTKRRNYENEDLKKEKKEKKKRIKNQQQIKNIWE